MGIQLDWNIDSESSRETKHIEDTETRRARWRGIVRFLVVLIVFLGIIGLVLWLISRRLDQIDQQLAAQITDTVNAEVIALRLGDRDAFLELQRSASDDWYVQQEAVYESYQALKLDRNVQLTGAVQDVTVDGQRGRAQVQEIIDGVPYVNTWFYWRYDEIVVDEETTIPGGWYHVPPDYTFWGQEETRDGSRFTIRYRSVDDAVARSMTDELDQWLAFACGFLNCDGVPHMTIDIVANRLPEPLWTDDGWQMIVPSPYMGRARADMPFNTELRAAVAELLVPRVIDQHLTQHPVSGRDAAFVRQSAIRWLVGRFAGVDTGAHFISSLTDTYGTGALGQMLRSISAEANVNEIALALGAPDAGALSVDWRDFIDWRLSLEDTLIANGDEGNWLSLVDTRDENARVAAYSRYNTNQPAEDYDVASVRRQTAPDGAPQLEATVNIGRGGEYRQEFIHFNLVDGTWRRAG